MVKPPCRLPGNRQGLPGHNVPRQSLAYLKINDRLGASNALLPHQTPYQDIGAPPNATHPHRATWSNCTGSPILATIRPNRPNHPKNHTLTIRPNDQNYDIEKAHDSLNLFTNSVSHCSTQKNLDIEKYRCLRLAAVFLVCRTRRFPKTSYR